MFKYSYICRMLQGYIKSWLMPVLRGGLFILFIGYYGSITLFWHTHHLPYGAITHSHPFSDPDHDHCSGEYQIIDALSAVFAEEAVLVAALVALFFPLFVFLIEDAFRIRRSNLMQVLYLRGPPSV